MKKIITTAILGALSVMPLSADYELTLIDSQGAETKQCVKSYSFSSNLDSIMKEYVSYKDVYSDQETLTNKLYFGKPVYRKVFKFSDFTVPYSNSNTLKQTPVISSEIDELVDLNYKGYSGNGLISSNDSRHIVYSNTGENIRIMATYSRISKQATVLFTQGRKANPSWSISDLTVTVEYTKQNDEVQSEINEINSFIHYTPSASTSNDVITQKLNNVAVKLKKGFTFNSLDNSCIEK